MPNNNTKQSGDGGGWGSANSDGHRCRPRVCLGPDQLADLRQRITQGDSKAIYDQLVLRVDQLVDGVEQCDDLPALMLSNAAFKVPQLARMFDMAMVGAIGRDPRVISAVIRVLTTLPEAQKRSGLPISNRSRITREVTLLMPATLDLVWHDMADDQRKMLVKWLADEVIRPSLNFVKRGYMTATGANIPVQSVMLPLMATMAIWGEPQAGDLTRERDELLVMYEASLRGVFGQDGYPEEDTGYGPSTGGSMVVVAHALQRAGWFDAFTLCPRLTKFPQAMLAIMQPSGLYLTNTGDHTDQCAGREFFLPRLAAAGGGPIGTWLAQSLTSEHPPGPNMVGKMGMELDKNSPAPKRPVVGFEVPLAKHGQLPASSLTLLALPYFDQAPPAHPQEVGAPTAYCDRSRGIVSFRDHWREDATLLIVDASQRSAMAQGHAHSSSGHFNLSALGEYFAIDTGRYCIEQDQHNLLLVNGKSGRSTNGKWTHARHPGRLTQYQPHPLCDMTAVDSSHQHQTQWAWRWAGLVKGGPIPAWAWTVDDINACDDWFMSQWTLNTSPENTIELHPQDDASQHTAHATITGCRQGHHLDVHLVTIAPGTYSKAHTLTLKQDEKTSGSPDYITPEEGEKDYARPRDMVHGPVFRRPRLIAELQGYTGQLMSIMLPRHHDQPPAVVRTLPTLQGAVALSVQAQDIEDVMIWSFGHGVLHADNIRANGQWALVRRHISTGEIIAWRVDENEPLFVGDRRIV